MSDLDNFDRDNNPDFIADNPWATVSGVDSWQDDYTRFRSGDPTYSGVDDLIGRTKTGRELDKGKY